MSSYHSQPSSESFPSSSRIRPSEPGAPVLIGRYRIEEHLGSGGMGVVYVAHDTERDERVALKTLQRMSSDGLLRLKNEFRSVADVLHPNLVVLHELVGESDEWFFTMELVHGKSFLDYVRGDESRHNDPTARSGAHTAARFAETLLAPTTMNSGEQREAPSARIADAAPPTPPSAPLSEERAARVRHALRQLTEGVAALHAAGKLHRDLKPNNVMVTAEGRVVILDFGLVSDALPAAGKKDGLAGTPAYMAPELGLLEPASTASDWYAVGVMLYEALVGSLPHYADSLTKLLRDKALIEPPPPRARVTGVPQDLDDLCMALLARHPAARPTAAQVLARVGGSLDRGSASTINPPVMSDVVVLGREAELAVLDEAYATVSRGAAATVYVGGRSGMGKSTLCNGFLQRLDANSGVLVLRGRCYERESMPFKAFDSIVDSLARFLATLPLGELAPLLPDHVYELARVFPVLLEIEAVAKAPHDAGASPAPNEIRQRAFVAVKELFARIAARGPLVLYIDDLQWGDIDSARLFEELVAPPAAPAALLLCSYRSEEIDKSPFLKKILDPQRAASRGGSVKLIEVGPLSFERARELALAIMTASGPDAERRAEAVARESDGSPLFIEQLVRHAESQGSSSSAADLGADEEPAQPLKKDVSLDELVGARVTMLAPEPRRLLEVVAVAGGPVELGVALSAAGVGAGAHGLLTALRGARLVRSLGVGENDTVESYHDRIRESVYSRLDAVDRRARHAAIARAIERRSPDDAARLALHFSGADERAKASPYAEIAADKAFATFAFERAAELVRMALDVDEGAEDNARLAALHEKAGAALAAAGRGAEAAPHFLEAAKRAAPERATTLRSRGAQQLLSSGHFEEGRAVLRPLLEEVGVPWPTTPARGLISAVVGVARLELRGRDFRPRAEADVPPAQRATLDVCSSAVKGLLSFDPVRAAGFLLRFTRLALDVGEPSRVSWGLALYGMMLMYEGSPSGFAKGMGILDEIERSGRAGEDPFLRGVLTMCRGIGHMGLTNFAEGIGHVESALTTLRDRCTDAAWECTTAVSAIAEARWWLGHFDELRTTMPAWRRQTERLGDVFGLVSAQLFCAHMDLVDGDPVGARASARAAMTRWWHDDYTNQHWYSDRIEIGCDLYEGDLESARARVDVTFRALGSANLLRVQCVRIYAVLLRAAITVASARGLRAPLLELRASRDASALAGLGTPCARGAADLIRGLLSSRRGRDAEARSRFASAADFFDAAGMVLHAAAVRRHRGVLCGGDEGQSEREAAEAILRARGVADPARWCATILAVRTGGN